VLTLFIATAGGVLDLEAARPRWPLGHEISRCSTYFIPARFLAVPMYRTMGTYGPPQQSLGVDPGEGDDLIALRDLGIKQASDKLPVELWTKAAVMDGATTCSCSGWSMCR